jgi:hypothetical protein
MVLVAAAVWLIAAVASAGHQGQAGLPPLPVPHPQVSDYTQLTHSETPELYPEVVDGREDEGEHPRARDHRA